MTARRLLLPTAEAAAHFNIKPATLRDWCRRGLVHPAGGTPRRPLWDLADIRKAEKAKKPRRADTTHRACDHGQ